MLTKFHGQFSDLQQAVAHTQVPGYWKDLGNHQQYRAHSGAVLNWWRSTGTVHFQGPAAEARDFAQKCDPVLSVRAVVPNSPADLCDQSEPEMEVAPILPIYRDPFEPPRRRRRRPRSPSRQT